MERITKERITNGTKATVGGVATYASLFLAKVGYSGISETVEQNDQRFSDVTSLIKDIIVAESPTENQISGLDTMLTSLRVEYQGRQWDAIKDSSEIIHSAAKSYDPANKLFLEQFKTVLVYTRDSLRDVQMSGRDSMVQSYGTITAVGVILCCLAAAYTLKKLYRTVIPKR